MPELAPDDPTPDPESPIDTVAGTPSPDKGTTFREVVEVATEAAEGIDTSDGVDAEEIVEAALEAAEKLHPPLGHHALSELRKLLVPIITAVVAALGAGGFAEWRASAAKKAAVEESEVRAEERVRESEIRAEEREKANEEKQRELEKLRAELRKAILKNASWDEVGELTVDQSDEVMILKAYTGASKPLMLEPEEIKDAYLNEAAQIAAQSNLPPRPPALEPRAPVETASPAR